MKNSDQRNKLVECVHNALENMRVSSQDNLHSLQNSEKPITTMEEFRARYYTRKIFLRWKTIYLSEETTTETLTLLTKTQYHHHGSTNESTQSLLLQSVPYLPPSLSFQDILHLWATCRDMQSELSASTYRINLIPHRSSLEDSHVSQTTRRFPNLSTLLLTGCTRLTNITSSLNSLPNLTHLSLKGCYQLTDEGVRVSSSSCNKLKRLNLGYATITDTGFASLTSSNNLTYLNLRSCNHITDKSVVTIGLQCKSLCTLNLWYTNQGQLSDKCLSTIPNLVRTLTSLCLSNCSQLSDDAMTYVAMLVNLKTLELSNVVELTDCGISKLGNLTRLTSLDIAGCYNVTDIGTTSVLPSYKSLTSLNCWYCPRISSATLLALEQSSSPSSSNTMRFINVMKTAVDDIGFASMCSSMKSLTSIDVVGLSPAKFTDNGFSHIASLQKLLSLYAGSNGNLNCISSIVSCENLRIVDFSNCREIGDDACYSIGKLRKVTTLNLMRCSRITDIGVSHLSLMTSLKSLNLANCRLITDTSLISSISFLVNLNSLTLWFCRKITDKGLLSLESLVLLQTLDLASCDNITDAGITVFRKMRLIRTLDLANVSLITDTGLIETVSTLTSLTALNLAELELVTDVGIDALGALPYLSSLNLWYCNKVTAVGVDSLVARNLNGLSIDR